jgi:hypothetical protein
MTGSIGGSSQADRVTRIHAVFRRHRPLGLDTNFFEGGFSSSTLTEVLAGLRELGLEVTLIDLYRHPTVRQLAAAGSGTGKAPNTLPWLRGRE